LTNDIEAFLDKLDFPMFIVTAAAGGRRSGCLVGFVSQCSVDPPRLLVCISEKNHTHEVAGAAQWLAVHLIPRLRTELVDLFGSHSGHEIDKFSRCEWTEGPERVPLLDACPSRIVGRVIGRIPVGDHTAFLVEATEASASAEQVYMFSMARLQEVEPGREP